MTNINKHTEESGRSMVEMIGVLAIIGVLSIGGISGYSKAMVKYKTNTTLDQITMLITNIRTTFGNQNDYRGLTTASAISMELVGQDLARGSSTSLTNAFQGEITINYCDKPDGTSCGAAANYSPYFKITVTKLERAACIAIATADWGGSPASGLMQIKIGSNAHTWSTTSGTLYTAADATLPVSIASANEQCTARSGNVTTTDIEWVYH